MARTLMAWLRRMLAHRLVACESHRIITNDEMEYLVWPSENSLPPNWRYLGRGGSEAELREYLAEVLAETSPAPLVRDTTQRGR